MADSVEDDVMGSGAARALVLAVAAASTAVGTYFYSKWRNAQPVGTCSCCEGQILVRDTKHGLSTCAKCNTSICKACRHANPLSRAFPGSAWTRTMCLCPQCSVEANELVAKAEAMDVFSARYEGKTGLDRSRTTAPIHSDLFDTQEEAELHLRLLAAEQGFDLVVQRQYESRQGQDGNYVFRVWRASGVAGHKAH
ncbi:hypothetical protein ACTJK6_02315 [Ralstonia sp. 22086]|uniref:hypothetical protein n=1 Tax=Ralstonia sp. 22086 TaxID=3453870 RepID=UPI003F840AE4